MRRQLPDRKEWRPKFAWWPVTTIDGQRVWLERIEERYRFSSWWEDYYEYRLPPESTTRLQPLPLHKGEVG
jgi:hypothetical protein